MKIFYKGNKIKSSYKNSEVKSYMAKPMQIIAIYTFDSSTNTLPEFNNGFLNTEIYKGTVYANETINIGVIDPNAKISFFVEGYERPLGNGTVYDNYIKYTPTIGLFLYHYTDGTESKITTNNEPIFTMGTSVQIVIENIAYTDVNNGDGTITRTITSDTLPSSISFKGKSDLTSVSYLDISNVIDMSAMFQHCQSLTSIELSNWNTSNVTDMGYMFQNCTKLTSLDLSNFDTSNVTDMSAMFLNCPALTSLDVSSFNTSKVESMSSMFYRCQLLTSIDVSNWNTSKVRTMSSMFMGCSSLTALDLSNFNTDKVYDMSYMFNNCTSLKTLDLSNFNTKAISYIDSMFNGCTNLISIDMSNSNVDSINDIIGYLPTRSSNSYGTITVSKNVLNSVDTTSANSKYWNIIN